MSQTYVYQVCLLQRIKKIIWNWRQTSVDLTWGLSVPILPAEARNSWCLTHLSPAVLCTEAFESMHITNLSVAPDLNQLLINTLQRSCVCYMYHNISCSQTKPSLKGFYFPIFQTPVSEAHVLKALASKFLYGQYRQNQLSIISFTQRIVMTSWK